MVLFIRRAGVFPLSAIMPNLYSFAPPSAFLLFLLILDGKILEDVEGSITVDGGLWEVQSIHFELCARQNEKSKTKWALLAQGRAPLWVVVGEPDYLHTYCTL